MAIENRYGCLNAGQIDMAPPGGAGWPNIGTPKDTCGVYGPYGVGGGKGPLNAIDYFTPWVDEDTYINHFETGSIQEVDLEAISFHPYHQHINPFQLIEIDTLNVVGGVIAPEVANWYQVGDWHDTLQFPAAMYGPYFIVKMRFQADMFTGHMLQHCHLLFHEDQGMMAQYEVKGKEGATWSGATEVDPRCILPTMMTGERPLLKRGQKGKNERNFPLGLCEGYCTSDSECESDICFLRKDFQAVPGCYGRGKKSKGYCVESVR